MLDDLNQRDKTRKRPPDPSSIPFPGYNDMVAYLRREAGDVGVSVILREAWHSHGGGDGYKDEATRQALLARLNDGASDGKHYVFVEAPYRGSPAITQLLVARVDKLAASSARAAETRAAEQKTMQDMIGELISLRQEKGDLLTLPEQARRLGMAVSEEVMSNRSRPPPYRSAADVFVDDRSAVNSSLLLGILQSVLAGTVSVSGMSAQRLEQAALLLASQIEFAITGAPSHWQDGVALMVRYMDGSGTLIDALSSMYVSASFKRTSVSRYSAAAAATDNPYHSISSAIALIGQDEVKVDALIVDNLDWMASHSRHGKGGFNVESRLVVGRILATRTELEAQFGDKIHFDERGRLVPKPATSHAQPTSPTPGDGETESANGSGASNGETKRTKAIRTQPEPVPIGNVKWVTPKTMPDVPYADIAEDDEMLDDDDLSALMHRVREYVIGNQRSRTAGRCDETGLSHDTAFAEMLRPECEKNERHVQFTFPLPPIQAHAESPEAVSAAISTCRTLMDLTKQKSMALVADLGLMATRIAPLVWSEPSLKRSILCVPGMWHISEHYLKGLGKKMESSGVDSHLTECGVFTSATATRNNWVNAKDGAASRAWNLWSESQTRFAWDSYIDDLKARVNTDDGGSVGDAPSTQPNVADGGASDASGQSSAASTSVHDELRLAERFVRLTPSTINDMADADRLCAAKMFEAWVKGRSSKSEMFRFHWESIEAYWGYTRHKAATRFVSALGATEFVKSLHAMLPVLCAWDRPVCARFLAAFARQIAALKNDAQFDHIWEAMKRDGCGLTMQETSKPGTALAYDFVIENGLHRFAKMDQSLRRGMSDPKSINTFFAGLPERFEVLRKVQQWQRGGDDDSEMDEVSDEAEQRADRSLTRSWRDRAALQNLESVPSPLNHDEDGKPLHHPLSKLCPVVDNEGTHARQMLEWKQVGVEAAKKLLHLRLPRNPSQHQQKARISAAVSKKKRAEMPEGYYDTPMHKLWSHIARNNIPTFATVGASFKKGSAKKVTQSQRQWDKTWNQVYHTVFNSDGNGVKVTQLRQALATHPVLDVCIPLMDSTSGAVRGGTKADLLEGVLDVDPPTQLPCTRMEGAPDQHGFGAIAFDFSAVLVRVCAVQKMEEKANRVKARDAEKSWSTFGTVVDKALQFVMARARAVHARHIYLCIDPYGDDCESEGRESASVKRWAHLSRANHRLTARRYGTIKSDTKIIGGAGTLMEVLTVSHNKRLLKDLVYNRLHDYCNGGDFLRRGETMTWVSQITEGEGNRGNRWICPEGDTTAAGDSVGTEEAGVAGRDAQDENSHTSTTEQTVQHLLSTSAEADFKFAAAVKDYNTSAGGDARPMALFVEDTDVITHIISKFWRACDTGLSWFGGIRGIAFMKQRDATTKYHHLHAITQRMRSEHTMEAAEVLLDVLHAAHVVSGCDSTSFLAGKKKKSFWSALTAMARSERLRTELKHGLGMLMSDDATTESNGERRVNKTVLDAIETMWAALHLPAARLQEVGTSDAVQLPRLGVIRVARHANYMDASAFPVSRCELEQHVLRCAYVLKQFRIGTDNPPMAHLWENADGWGYYIDDEGVLQVRWHGRTSKTMQTLVKELQSEKRPARAKSSAGGSHGGGTTEEVDAQTREDIQEDVDDVDDREAEDEDEDDEFWGDEADDEFVDDGLPADALPLCTLPIVQGARVAICDGESGVWKIGQVTKSTSKRIDVKFEDEGRSESTVDIRKEDYGLTWVQLAAWEELAGVDAPASVDQV